MRSMKSTTVAMWGLFLVICIAVAAYATLVPSQVTEEVIVIEPPTQEPIEEEPSVGFLDIKDRVVLPYVAQICQDDDDAVCFESAHLSLTYPIAYSSTVTRGPSTLREGLGLLLGGEDQLLVSLDETDPTGEASYTRRMIVTSEDSDYSAFGFTGEETLEEAEAYLERVRETGPKELLTVDAGENGTHYIWLYYPDQETRTVLGEILSSMRLYGASIDVGVNTRVEILQELE